MCYQEVREGLLELKAWKKKYKKKINSTSVVPQSHPIIPG